MTVGISGRVFGAIFTLGLSEISRATIGSTNHWAFVARAKAKAPGLKDKYFLADFGEGAVIPTLPSWYNVGQGHGLQTIRNAQELTGTVLMSLEDTVNFMNTDKDNMNTWVVRPKYKGDWQYAYDSNSDNKYAAYVDLPWKKLETPKSLLEISEVIAEIGKKRGTKYHYNSNNCQHFAEAMFDYCV